MTRFIRSLFACFVPLVLVIAGCGGGPSSNPSNGTFTISPGTTTIDTNGQVQFTAMLSNGQPATNINWTVTTGTNDNTQLGQGTISPTTGLYFPPSALSKNSVQIQVQANSTGNLFQPATAVVTVTPGFIQTVTPENATVAAGGTVPLAATIAQIGGGSVNFTLGTSPTGGSSPGAAGGAISNANCQTSGSITSSNPFFTSCTATYTAPSAVPMQAVYAIGSVASNSATTSFSKLLLNSSGLNTSPLQNQGVQTSAIQLGTSGGNNNDVDIDPTSGQVLDCASGTLGSLVKDQANNLYILSNNHVLADSDQGKVGDAVIQPGLVDTGCVQLAAGVAGITQVGQLTYFVPLLYPPTVPNPPVTNVDAALATTNATSVDASGAIIALGASGGGNNQIAAAAPAAGTGEVLTSANLNSIHVAKSGRTTGLTCSTVDTISTTIQVQYFLDAAETQPYTNKTYTNQIGMPGNYFSDSGDSGSLVVDTANAQPVALFFAGSTATATQPGESFAQPIGDVLTELAQFGGTPSGTTFSMVGGAPHTVNCLNYDANTATSSAVVSTSRMNAAKTVASQQGAAIVDASKGILGVAAGASLDQPGQAAVLVYTDQNHAGPIAVPQTIGGLPTRVIATTASAVASGETPASSSVIPGIQLPQATLDAAEAVQKQQAAQIMSDPAFFGVGVTQSQDNPSEAALMVFINRTRTPRSQPATVGGLRVRYRTMNPIKINFSAAAHR
jgi:hypothetical protein